MKYKPKKIAQDLDIRKKRIFHEAEEASILSFQDRKRFKRERIASDLLKGAGRKLKKIKIDERGLNISRVPIHYPAIHHGIEGVDFLSPRASFSLTFYLKLLGEWLSEFVDSFLNGVTWRRITPAMSDMNFVGVRVESGWKAKMMPLAITCVVIAAIIGGIGIYNEGMDAKAEVADDAYTAMNHLSYGAEDLKSLNFDGALGEFTLAQEKMAQAQESLDSVGVITAKLVEILPFTSGSTKLLEVGTLMAEAGSEFTLGLDTLFTSTKSELGDSFQVVKDFEAPDTMHDPSIKTAHEHIRRALEKVEAAEKKQSKINKFFLPAEAKDSVDQLEQKLPELKESLVFMDQTFSFMEKIMAVDKADSKILVLNANTNELRAAGGFIGSAEVISFSNGKMKNFEVLNIYDPSGQLKEDIVPPKPLTRVTDRFGPQDGNWYFDFRDSAATVQRLYESSGAESVDAVVLVNKDVISDLLGVVGEVKVPQFETKFTKDNLANNLQRIIEIESKSEDDPKEVLSYLVPEVVQRVLSSKPKVWVGAAGKVFEAMKKKDIMFYSDHEDLQAYAEANGWTGRVDENEKDYLAVVDVNVAGGKTNDDIERDIHYSVDIDDAGEAIATLELVYKHNGAEGDDLSKVTHASWQKVFVPRGSEFIAAEGYDDMALPKMNYKDYETLELQDEIETTRHLASDNTTQITEESGKTVFGNWINIAVSETKVYKLKYKLPQGYKNSYELKYQHQSGNHNADFEAEVNLPSDASVEWQDSSEGSIRVADNKLIIELQDRVDALFSSRY